MGCWALGKWNFLTTPAPPGQPIPRDTVLSEQGSKPAWAVREVFLEEVALKPGHRGGHSCSRSVNGGLKAAEQELGLVGHEISASISPA